jgi:tetratricopeptide (TPR) repeat protein/tRNA A-37 threonylcarbamoyl transferase component Bud32
MVCPQCGRTSSSGQCASCGIVLTLGDGDAAIPASAPPTDSAAASDAGATPVEDPELTRTVGAKSRVSLRPDEPLAGTLWDRHGVEAASDLVGHWLGERYQILQLVGAGGMGAVYRAWDKQLGIDVALKTRRPEVAADAYTASLLEGRFKQELLLARKVTHKNIVRVYDMGEVSGITYITMPFLQGEDLSTILKREGKLPVPSVMKVARSVAAGLYAAHEAGVVHRDLKPANIMIDANGDGLIMDFGVARSTDGPKPPSVPSSVDNAALSQNVGQTMPGSVLGTIEYMAPEQARSEEVDQRADIYAFGLILYDLLLGRTRRMRSESALTDLNLRLEQTPPAVRSYDPTIPLALDTIITRCIQPNVADRFLTTGDLVAALEQLDEEGEPLPTTRRLTGRMVPLALVAGAWLIGLTYWQARGPAGPVERDPVTVVIADFQNQTGDQRFNQTLEPVVKLALEGASFISGYDRVGIVRSLGAPAPEIFDEQAAVQLAIKQGLGFVLSGALTRNGDRIGVSVKATEAVTGNVIGNDEGTARAEDEILTVVTNLATNIRVTLGGDRPDMAERVAMERLSARPLDVMRDYGGAMLALSLGQFNDALLGFSRAIEGDSTFGFAFAGMAIALSNLGRPEEAKKYVNEALRLADRMTERERYRTRGLFALLKGDTHACAKEYGDLVTRYPGDGQARNNRALCLSKVRELPAAAQEMKQVVRVFPNRPLYRVNLAFYAAYSGDFQTAEYVSLNVRDQTSWAHQSLALAQTLQGRLAEAADTYRQLGKSDVGPSFAASGLADLSVYQGRYAEAVRILTDAAAADLAAKEADRAATKLAAIGYTESLRQNKPAALVAAEKALASSEAMTVRFLAARILVEAGRPSQAKSIATSLANEGQAEPRAYGAIVEGLIALEAGDAGAAIKRLNDANGHLDTWIGHFDLGRAYLAANAYTQADLEFDRCVRRRGEALALFLDEEPTFGLFPSVHYYQGLARDGLKSARSTQSYRAYLDIRGESSEDPLVAEVRQRTAAQ